ncbi:hypothetical protein SIAM614_00090 [Stappia aggregata IAM 12614]|uniref:Uncharacterized protein n=1 Tax=Roseibium aggregatum (strain ATCC 25650 / DSM 13394 / JCM 20685 / NBRC 16684 / NCIMB 2208 / IAM 12614 / B1) TaxID=384765 RepID=A0P4A0_ROSAI|nr:hypothetical protein SIAM614_00090 [Stappia aggregata IAM 12614] [Roseibium aggregatum IAM 12614]
MNQHEQHQVKRVGDDMALASLDLLALVIAGNTPAFRGFIRLTVNNTGYWRGRASFQFSRGGDKDVVEGLPKTGIAPAREIASHRGGRGKVFRKCPSLTAVAGDIKDRVHHFPHVGRPRSPAMLGHRDQWCYDRPFPFRQIACLTQSVAVRLFASDITQLPLI